MEKQLRVNVFIDSDYAMDVLNIRDNSDLKSLFKTCDLIENIDFKFAPKISEQTK